MPSTASSDPIGYLDILNTGLGHLRMTFDAGSPDDLDKAKRAIADMLRRGYSIFVELGGVLTPVRVFDPGQAVYLVDAPEESVQTEAAAEPAPSTTRSGNGRRGYKKRGGYQKLVKVPIDSAKATAVGRTAGG